MKCEQYWPNNIEETITLSGGLSVLLQEVIPFADYELRKLIISKVRVLYMYIHVPLTRQ